MPTPDLVAEICVGNKKMDFIAIGLLIIFGIIWGSLIGRISQIRPTVWATIAIVCFICGIVCTNSHCGIELLGTVLVFISIVILFFFMYSYDKRKQIEDEKVKAEREKRIDEERKEKKKKYELEIDSLKTKYGEITNLYGFPDEIDITKKVIVFGESKKIWLVGNIYDFVDIIGCSINDDSQITKAKVEYKTSTSTGSMIGRAVVGGVLTGGVGAVIGGATAAKKTVAVPSGSDTVKHRYTITVNINSLSSPIVNLKCYSNEQLKNELWGILNIIIRQNNKQ